MNPQEISLAGVARVRIWMAKAVSGGRNRPTPIVLTALSFLVFLVVAAAVPQAISRHDPFAIDSGQQYKEPTTEFLFGTDALGRSVFAQVIWGARVSLASALAIVGIAALVGTPLGLLSGYYGGLTGKVTMRVTDIFLSFPDIALAIVVAAVLGRSLTNAVLAVALALWPQYARLVRGETLKIKQREYVQAARAIGASQIRIIWKYVFPNVSTPLVVKSAFDLGLGVLAIASLSFIGLGAPPPTPEWGRLVAQGRGELSSAWWIAVLPGTAVFLTVLSFNILGHVLSLSLGKKS